MSLCLSLGVCCLTAVTKAFPADKIFLTLSGRDSEKLQFSTQLTSLEPGSSAFKLFCPVRDFGIRFRTSDLHRRRHHLEVLTSWTRPKSRCRISTWSGNTEQLRRMVKLHGLNALRQLWSALSKTPTLSMFV